MLIGLGGGAASSTSGENSSDLDFASVQRGNPEQQRLAQMVINTCVALGENNPIAFIHDVGAGGLSNALPELVKDAGFGGKFELRQVASADKSMSPLQIWCCEAQERYVMLVNEENMNRFTAIASKFIMSLHEEQMANKRQSVNDVPSRTLEKSSSRTKMVLPLSS